MEKERVVIIGGGQAGSQAAISLRQGKFDGAIDLFCAEDVLPYQRPPLSKAYLKGEMEAARLFFRPMDFYEGQNIRVHVGAAIASLDPIGQAVVTVDGERHGYDKLLLATGAPPRRLTCPGADLDEIYYLRSLPDADALSATLSANGRIAIIGAGYIGLEVAAVLRGAGRDVTVLEAADRPLARVASEPVSAFYERRHREAGVDLRLGAMVEGFLGDDVVRGVRLADGEEIECCAALVGIGAAPAVSLAAGAGLETDNGIVVDDHARTSDPNIWSAGDCANFPSPRYGRRIRLESVPNAIEQAKAVAANMLGGDVTYDALPWFWSDQYDVKLQTAGLFEGYDGRVVRGDPDENSFSVWYLKDGAVLAVDAINDPGAFMMGKKFIMSGKKPSADQLADTSLDLKTLL